MKKKTHLFVFIKGATLNEWKELTKRKFWIQHSITVILKPTFRWKEHTFPAHYSRDLSRLCEEVTEDDVISHRKSV